MTWNFKTKVVACVAGAAMCAVVDSPPPAQARDGAAIAAGIIGAGIIGAAIGSAIANGNRGGAPRRARNRNTNDESASGGGSQSAVQVQGDERFNPVLVTQYALTFRGFYEGRISGRMDKDTALAIAKWQQKSKLEVTGRLTDGQTEQIRQIIVDLQQRLDRLGFTPGPSDGNVTKRLLESVQRFQTKLGVRADGVLLATEFAAMRDMEVNILVAGAMEKVFDKIAAANRISAGGAIAIRDIKNPDARAAAASFRSLCQETPVSFSMTAMSQNDTGTQSTEFCQVRAQVMQDGSAIFKTLVTKSSAITPEAVRTECERFAKSKEDEISGIDSKEPAVIANELIKGMPSDPRQRDIAISNAKVCLGFGYADDKPEVALGSTLFLLGLGETDYAEVVAGHFALGVGTPKDVKKSAAWIDFAVHELESGKPSLMKVNTTDRVASLRKLSGDLKAAAVVQDGPSFGPRFGEPPPAAKPAPVNDGMPPYVSKLDQNIVFIWTGEGHGTGFFIGPNLVMTNDHVVRGHDRILLASKAMPLNVQRGKVLYRGKSNGSGIDAAVIEVEGYQHPTYFEFAPEQPPVSSFIGLGGFPGVALDTDRGFADFQKVFFQGDLPTAEQLPHMTVSTGSVQSYFIDKDTGLQRMQESAQAAKGNSGSPIVNGCGQVVALLDSGSYQNIEEVARNGAETVFVWTFTAKEVMKFLDSTKVGYRKAADPCQRSGVGSP